MDSAIVVVCDERDLEIGAAVRADLTARGCEASLETCDAAEEGLGSRTREALRRASQIIVVVREGGRGNRLLHAAEDEAGAGAIVHPLLADAAPDGGVSARTGARIETLGRSFAPSRATPPRATEKRRSRAPLLALLAGVLAVVAIVTALLWPRGFTPVSGPPVVLTGMQSNSGWIVQFHLKEEASFLEYKLPSDPDFVSTGDLGPTSGPDRDKPHAKLFAVLPDVPSKVRVQVRYRAMNGEQRGPFEVIFDPAAEGVASVKSTLANIPDWISFRLFNGRRLCYFSTLLSYKYAFRSIRYGVDTDLPTRSVRFEPRDTPGIDNGDELFIDLPPDASFVTVELTFLDGTTQKKRFPARF